MPIIPVAPGYIRMSFLFDTLVWKDDQEYLPALAKSWEYNREENACIFKLQENVSWHDEKKFTARAKGCPETVIRYRHAGRNSLLPAVTAVGIQMSHMLSGVLFIEIVFSYPGVGLLLYNSLLTRDYPLLQGILLVLTIGVLTINLLVDLIYQKLDPRVAYAR